MKRERRSDCPIAFALDLFGDRWTLLVVRDLIFQGKSRFRDFLASEEQIASNILADRLDLLVSAGVIRRTPDPDDGRRAVYVPTSKGLDLIPVVLEIVRWSARHDRRTGAPPEFVAALELDTKAVAASLRARFSEIPARVSRRSKAPSRSPRRA